MSRILSLDPGVTTGVSYIGFDNDSVFLEKAFQVTGGHMEFISWFRELDQSEFDIIVCEDFVLRPGVHGANIEPAYVIGALHSMTEEVVLQPPSQKKLVDDKVLKNLEVFSKGEPHANDATRHGIIYLRNKKHMPTLLKGWE